MTLTTTINDRDLRETIIDTLDKLADERGTIQADPLGATDEIMAGLGFDLPAYDDNGKVDR